MPPSCPRPMYTRAPDSRRNIVPACTRREYVIVGCAGRQPIRAPSPRRSRKMGECASQRQMPLPPTGGRWNHCKQNDRDAPAQPTHRIARASGSATAPAGPAAMRQKTAPALATPECQRTCQPSMSRRAKLNGRLKQRGTTPPTRPGAMSRSAAAPPQNINRAQVPAARQAHSHDIVSGCGERMRFFAPTTCRMTDDTGTQQTVNHHRAQRLGTPRATCQCLAQTMARRASVTAATYASHCPRHHHIKWTIKPIASQQGRHCTPASWNFVHNMMNPSAGNVRPKAM